MPVTPISAAVRAIAAEFAALPTVTAVALAGSSATGMTDAHSDYDLYVYADPLPTPADRAAIADRLADHAHPVEIDNPYWGSEDAWIDRASGRKADLIYWSPGWIEGELQRVLGEHRASLGYSTCLWHTVRQSTAVFDRIGWFDRLRQRADQPYPEPLRRAIIALNYPVLGRALPSYRTQIALAVERRDLLSVQHRVTALLASTFDILFALNRALHPGEKRLLAHALVSCPVRPAHLEQHVTALVASLAAPWGTPGTLAALDALLGELDAVLLAEGVIAADGTVR